MFILLAFRNIDSEGQAISIPADWMNLKESREAILRILTDLLFVESCSEPSMKRLKSSVCSYSGGEILELRYKVWMGRRQKRREFLKNSSSMAAWDMERLVFFFLPIILSYSALEKILI